MELVKGYTQQKALTVEESIQPATDADFQLQETLYAVLPDGRIFTTGLIVASAFFDKKGRKWKQADELPEGVEFCGNYPVPKAIK
jgi:hypothetical protein